MGRYFGTDGFRGEANENLTADHAYKTGRFLGWYFNELKRMNGFDEAARIVIGKDTRLSGYMLETALTSGLVSAGMDVFEIGPLPTPAVAHLTKSMCADCGIMITASHNPACDNGIKIFTSSGYKLPEELEGKIEDIVLPSRKIFFPVLPAISEKPSVLMTPEADISSLPKAVFTTVL